MQFARAAKENPNVRKALAQVVLFEANVHEDAGEKLEDSYGARGIPHFFVMTADGKAFGRWRGYGSPGRWVEALDGFLADRTPIEEKAARFEKAPTETLAASLGRIGDAKDDPKSSALYFREAERLAGKPVAAYADGIFRATYVSARRGEATPGDLRAAANHVMSIEGTEPEDAANLALMMAGLAKDKSEPSLLEPYLDWGIRKSEAMSGPAATGLKNELQVVEALEVEKDPARAYRIKRGGMPAGWEQDADALNELAWWCFENKVALDEAEGFARKGIDLARDGKQKAMILDTAAEICNLRDDCREAVDLMSEAVKADPEGDHYRKQLARFQGLLAKKNG